MHKQSDLFGSIPSSHSHSPISDTERRKRQEYTNAHRLFKLYKSNKFKSFTDDDKHILKRFYGINL